MDTPIDRFVPKVHPASRPVEPEDPLSLHATATAGDPDAMLRGVVAEFFALGWDLEHILSLFREPDYPVLHGLGLALGEEDLRRRVETLVRFHGLFQFRATVVEAPEEFEPELVQIDPLGSGEGRHGVRL